MKSFVIEKGVVAPMPRANVDTDMIIPKQFLKSIKRSGFGPNLFDELRYLDKGEPDQDCSQRPVNPDFVLNKPAYQGAKILLAGANFGCGSSREHAPWALDDFGFRAVIASSFADIFFNNCFNNGLLPVVLSEAEVAELFAEVGATPGCELEINLPEQVVISPSGKRYSFDVAASRKERLLNGWDDIGLTLNQEAEIRAFEEKWRNQSPWLFDAIQ